MDIENIIDNLNLISSAIPDYSEGRNRGLLDAESEKIAFEAILEAIELLEKLEIQNIDKLKILVAGQQEWLKRLIFRKMYPAKCTDYVQVFQNREEYMEFVRLQVEIEKLLNSCT